MSQKIIKVIIVDDEPLARQRIKTLLENMNRLEVLQECGDGYQAVRAIVNLNPDLVFLDIEMPECNGFDIIKMIGVKKMPVVIFVTAYDQYALKAFDVHAIDYLLKPFDRLRFEQAVEKAVREISLRNQVKRAGQLGKFLDEHSDRNNPNERMLIRTSGRVSIVQINQIDWISSAGNYVEIHVDGKTYLKRETMTKVERILDPNKFVRIHRSTIINIEKIKELLPHFNGNYIAVLHSGQRLMMSRRYRSGVSAILGDLK